MAVDGRAADPDGRAQVFDRDARVAAFGEQGGGRPEDRRAPIGLLPTALGAGGGIGDRGDACLVEGACHVGECSLTSGIELVHTNRNGVPDTRGRAVDEDRRSG